MVRIRAAGELDAEATQEFRATTDRFVLKQRLATSATATVWRAWDEEQQREVALKRLHPHLLVDEAARGRIRAEADAASSIRHPAIVPLMAAEISPTEATLVFPFIPGTTLADRLRDGPPMEAREAAGIGAEIADALAVAHEAGIVHRDVKPSNIMLADDGQPRLLDFGIARAGSTAAEGDIELTAAGTAVGTLPYMSPEQLAGADPTPATDVFALGVVLYEMLAGRRPFEAANPVALSEQHRHPVVPIESQPEAVAGLALAALAADPAGRPSAAQFSRAARGWLEGRGDVEAPTIAVPVASPIAAPVPIATGAGAAQSRIIGALPAVGAVVIAVVLAAGLILWAPAGTGHAPEDSAPAAAPQTDAGDEREEVERPAVEARDDRPAVNTTSAGGTDRPAARNGGNDDRADRGKANNPEKDKDGDKGKRKGDERRGGNGDDDDDDDGDDDDDDD